VQLVHEWSTLVDETQTGWNQTLAPVLEAAIDLIDSKTFAREGNSEIGRRSVCTDRGRGSFGAGITFADFQSGGT